MMSKLSRAEARYKRKKRVRKKISGTPETPRMTVFRSSRHIYAQIIDDISTKTLVDASSLSKEIRAKKEISGGNIEGASAIGKAIAEKALNKGIKKVVFDRNGFLYHGRIKAFADGAREQGLEF
ncbi:MAG: 50S ribosomal protein L18 [Deltaproteobacteria bacterium]|nr:50S ribosomal protein L18 [Deltaproteobacteria bacterium]